MLRARRAADGTRLRGSSRPEAPDKAEQALRRTDQLNDVIPRRPRSEAHLAGCPGCPGPVLPPVKARRGSLTRPGQGEPRWVHRRRRPARAFQTQKAPAVQRRPQRRAIQADDRHGVSDAVRERPSRDREKAKGQVICGSETYAWWTVMSSYVSLPPPAMSTLATQESPGTD